MEEEAESPQRFALSRNRQICDGLNYNIIASHLVRRGVIGLKHSILIGREPRGRRIDQLIRLLQEVNTQESFFAFRTAVINSGQLSVAEQLQNDWHLFQKRLRPSKSRRGRVQPPPLSHPPPPPPRPSMAVIEFSRKVIATVDEFFRQKAKEKYRKKKEAAMLLNPGTSRVKVVGPANLIGNGNSSTSPTRRRADSNTKCNPPPVKVTNIKGKRIPSPTKSHPLAKRNMQSVTVTPPRGKGKGKVKITSKKVTSPSNKENDFNHLPPPAKRPRGRPKKIQVTSVSPPRKGKCTRRTSKVRIEVSPPPVKSKGRLRKPYLIYDVNPPPRKTKGARGPTKTCQVVNDHQHGAIQAWSKCPRRNPISPPIVVQRGQIVPAAAAADTDDLENDLREVDPDSMIVEMEMDPNDIFGEDFGDIFKDVQL